MKLTKTKGFYAIDFVKIIRGNFRNLYELPANYINPPMNFQNSHLSCPKLLFALTLDHLTLKTVQNSVVLMPKTVSFNVRGSK